MNYYMKLWGICVFIITLIYIFILCVINKHNIKTFNDNEINRTILKSITPAYPPPLFNYTDSPNVLKKIIPINKIS